MLQTISKHIKDLYFIKQILYGFPKWLIIRNLDSICTSFYVDRNCKWESHINHNIVGKNIYEICIKRVANYYDSCRKEAINSDKIFISKKIYAPSGEKELGLLYFSPYKDKQNNIIGCASYNIDLAYLKKTATFYLITIKLN